MMNRPVLTMWLKASGKTTVTRAIAESIWIKSADLDHEIIKHLQLQTKYGQDITVTRFVDEICSWCWHRFRFIENLICQRVIDTYVLTSLWGGTPAFENNRVLIDSKKSIKILLDISVEEQMRRLRNDDEGNKNRPDLWQSLAETYHDRIDIYRNFADHIILVDGKSIEDVRDEILWITEINNALKRAV